MTDEQETSKPRIASPKKRETDEAGSLLPRKTALEKLKDHLARRDHSEPELQAKLSRHYSDEETEEALDFARAKGWLMRPEELSERAVKELARRSKGYAYIAKFLESKGLPPVAKDRDEEIRKARAILEAKLAKSGPFDYEEQSKIYRLLANRGFDEETIREVAGQSFGQDIES